jgi:hypothetical protein
VLVGPFVPRRIALGVTTVAAAVTLLSFIWSTVDGKGNDPWWTALVGATAAGIAIALLPPGPDSSAEESGPPAPQSRTP